MFALFYGNLCLFGTGIMMNCARAVILCLHNYVMCIFMNSAEMFYCTGLCNHSKDVTISECINLSYVLRGKILFYKWITI